MADQSQHRRLAGVAAVDDAVQAPREGGRGVIEKAARNRYRTDLLMHPSGGSVLLRIVCVSLAVFDIMPSSRSTPRTPALLGDRAPSQRQL